MTQAFVRVNFRVLRELLRLPTDVRITAANTHVLYPEDCVLCLEGDTLPASGELQAEYEFAHTTIVTFKEFTPV